MTRPTVAEILAKPATMPWYPDAASAWGYGKTKAYRAAKQGTAPVPILKLDGRYVVTRSALLAALGIPDSEAG